MTFIVLFVRLYQHCKFLNSCLREVGCSLYSTYLHLFWKDVRSKNFFSWFPLLRTRLQFQVPLLPSFPEAKILYRILTLRTVRYSVLKKEIMFILERARPEECGAISNDFCWNEMALFLTPSCVPVWMSLTSKPRLCLQSKEHNCHSPL
jgi:hypothetical protein